MKPKINVYHFPEQRLTMVLDQIKTLLLEQGSLRTNRCVNQKFGADANFYRPNYDGFLESDTLLLTMGKDTVVLRPSIVVERGLGSWDPNIYVFSGFYVQCFNPWAWAAPGQLLVPARVGTKWVERLFVDLMRGIHFIIRQDRKATKLRGTEEDQRRRQLEKEIRCHERKIAKSRYEIGLLKIRITEKET